MQFHDVLVVQHMGEVDVLSVVDVRAPAAGDFDFAGQFPVNELCQILDGGADGEREGILQVGWFAGGLGIDPYDLEPVEQALRKGLELGARLGGEFQELALVVCRFCEQIE